MKVHLLLLAVLISSCASTQDISWRTGTTSSLIDLPAEARTVTVLNRVRFSYPYNRVISSFPNPNRTEIADGAIQGLSRQVRSQNYLTINSIIADYKTVANGRFPNSLSKSEVINAARGSDILISLEKFDQSISDDYRIQIDRIELGRGVYKEVDLFIGKRSIDVQLGWRMYDGKTGEILDAWEQQENYFYEAESRERIRATNILNTEFKKELTNLGVRHGRRYGSRVSPTAHKRSMKLYASGNLYLEQGIKFIHANNWESAEKEWIKGIKKSHKRKQKAMLYHNLAVSYERKGDNNQARSYARLAASQHPLGVETQSLVGF
ncbi:MAG: DUF6340 family protein [Bacteroidia bacterium]